MSHAKQKSCTGVSPNRNGLLPGWIKIALAELGMGRTHSVEPASTPKAEFELWSVPIFPTGKPEIVLGSTVGSNKQRVQEGDVLLCKINPRINRVWRVAAESGRPQIASTEWIVFRSPLFHPDFLMWRFRESAFREALGRTVAGVGGSLTRARPMDVAKLEIQLPPLAEQRRIVERLEKLAARSRRARAALDSVPQLLAQARQSLLAAAFRGDLTKDWRRQTTTDETASVFLAALAKFRQAKLGRKLAAKFSGGGPWTSTGLPNTWAWCCLQELAAARSHALKAGPFGSALTKKSYSPSGYKIYGQEQVIRADPKFGDYYISETKFKQLRSCAVETGDILVSLVGTIGRVLIMPADHEPGIINPRLVKISLHQPLERQFIAHYLGSPLAKAELGKKSHGGTMDILNLGILRELKVPLAPLPEQKEIVRQLERAMARLDAAAAAHASAVAELDRLDQSLLARAFTGQLVPQNPKDEPAAKLLARIRHQRAAKTKNKQA